MKILFEILQSVVGSGYTLFKWQKSLGNLLAVAGTNRIVCIYNRQGNQIKTLTLPGLCTSLDWDKDGEILTITQDFNGILYMWNSNTNEVSKLDTGMKEGLSLSLWSKYSHLLAIGTMKGNVILYNHRNRRKVPIIGKHTKRIHSGIWSVNNILALGGDDRTLTLSDSDGNTIFQKEMKFDIQIESIHFSPDGDTLTAVGGVKILYLFNVKDDTGPLELIFQPRYGDITSHVWFDNNHIMLGFTKGYMIMISRETDAMGEEVFQSHNHKNYLTDISLSPSAPLLASVGEHQIKLHEFSDLKGMYGMVQVEDTSGLIKTQWTEDGQLISANLKNGGLVTFLVQLPQLGHSYNTKIAYLTSLLQVTVVNNVEEEPPLVIDCPIEPLFLTIGPTSIAMGMNNRVWFTELSNQNKQFTERSYISTVTDIGLNSTYSSVLSNNGIELHQIMPSSVSLLGVRDEEYKQPEGRRFPEEEQSDSITCQVLTSEFLIYGTENGNIVYFTLEDWQFVNEYKHVVGISKVYSDPSCTRLVFVDEKSDAFLYNPINDMIIQLPEYPVSAIGLLWDQWPLDKYIFIVFDKERIYTYVYYRDTIEGPQCVYIETTELPFGYKPLLLYNGDVSCLNLTGKIKYLRLKSHNYTDDQDLLEENLKISFKKSATLHRLKDAWSYATAIDKVDMWNQLSTIALYHLDIGMAIRAFQQVKNIAIVHSLQDLQCIEDRNLLVGYLNMYNENYNTAQNLFLKSSNPKAALEMRCDLLQWEQALELAKTLDEDRLPLISKQYAQQLEFICDYGNSLIHYEKAITNLPQFEDHDEQCKGGLARSALHMGDMRRGVKLAQSSSNKRLKIECAEILENLRLYSEAGMLYEQAQNLERAAVCYIKLKNWNKVGTLISNLPSSTRLHSQYAKGREGDGYYTEAALAYETAMEYDNAVRIYLDYLKQPEEAVRVVNESKSIEGAKMVARFFQQVGDYGSALEFLVISKCNDEAYTMAESHGQMDQYASVIGDNGSDSDYKSIATYYQKSDNNFKAGIFFMKAKEYAKSLNHFLSCPISLFPDGDHIHMAIKVIGLAKLESLSQRLHGYLLGELDGEPKDARYLFAMYMANGQYQEASQTAILIAKEDQNTGNYRTARDLLYQMYIELREHGIKIPSEMRHSLMLLHSYILVKLHVKRGDHDKAARLLLRVASNISKFPSHIVALLTSTVIECQRSGLKSSAFSYAAMLMRPEYRQKIDDKWKKKIESIVRKPDRSEVEEVLEACLYCSFMLPQTRLDCPECKNTLPYCIVTGRHMVKDNWTECPSCKFPALYSEFKSVIDCGEVCPMCGDNITSEQIQLFTDVKSRLTD